MSQALNDLINTHGGIDHITFEMDMVPLYGGGLLAHRDYGDKDEKATARISEARYRLDEHYKVTLVFDNERFGVEHFYQMDLMTMLRQGSVRMYANNEPISVSW